MQIQPGPDSSPPATAPASPRPEPVELVQRWCDGSGVEGSSLEWMLDRTRPPREART